MIIWGSTGKEKSVGAGRFFCPRCMAQAGYRHVRVSRYFTLYFIPLFPMETLGEYVQCNACSGQFKTEVLRISPDEIKALTSPWRCLGCGNLNAPGEERCINCGGVERAVPGVPVAIPVAASAPAIPTTTATAPAASPAAQAAAEDVPVLPATPPAEGSHQCPVCSARFDPEGDGDALMPCPHCGVTMRPVAQ